MVAASHISHTTWNRLYDTPVCKWYSITDSPVTILVQFEHPSERRPPPVLACKFLTWIKQQTFCSSTRANALFKRLFDAKVIQLLRGEAIDLAICSRQTQIDLIQAACFDGNLDFLQKNRSYLSEDPIRSNIMHWAAISANCNIVQFLLQEDPELANIQDGRGWIPIQHAAKEGHLQVVKQLLDTSHLKNAFTPLHIAIEEEHLDLVAFFLTENNPWTQFIGDSSVYEHVLPIELIILLEADAKEGKKLILLEILQLFLDKGFANIPCQDGLLPIHYAAKENALKSLQHIYFRYPDTHRPIQDGFLPIYYATIMESRETFTWLLSRFPGLAYYSTGDCPSLLHLSLSKNLTTFLPSFIAAYPYSVFMKALDGLHPLHIICNSFCVNSDREAVIAILNAHPDAAKIRSPSCGSLPFHFAVYQGASIETADALLKANPEAINTAANDGTLPLHSAVSGLFHLDKTLLIGWLHQKNPQAINTPTNQGWLPLHIALSQPEYSVFHHSPPLNNAYKAAKNLLKLHLDVFNSYRHLGVIFRDGMEKELLDSLFEVYSFFLEETLSSFMKTHQFIRASQLVRFHDTVIRTSTLQEQERQDQLAALIPADWFSAAEKYNYLKTPMTDEDVRQLQTATLQRFKDPATWGNWALLSAASSSKRNRERNESFSLSLKNPRNF